MLNKFTGFGITPDTRFSKIGKCYYITPNYETTESRFSDIANILILDTYNFNYDKISHTSFVYHPLFGSDDDVPALILIHIDIINHVGYMNIDMLENHIEIATVLTDTNLNITNTACDRIYYTEYTTEKLYSILGTAYA